MTDPLDTYAARSGALVERAADADAKRGVPYEEFCRQRAACTGRSHCPLDPTCAD